MDSMKSLKQEPQSATTEKSLKVLTVKRRASKATAINPDMTSTGIRMEFIRRGGKVYRVSWNEAQNQQLIRWYFDGLSDDEITEKFGDRGKRNVKEQRILLTGQGLGKDMPVHPLYTELMEASRNFTTPHPV